MFQAARCLSLFWFGTPLKAFHSLQAMHSSCGWSVKLCGNQGGPRRPLQLKLPGGLIIQSHSSQDPIPAVGCYNNRFTWFIGCVAHVCCLQFSWLIHLSCPLLGFLSWDDASGIRVVHGLCPGACWYPSTCWKCHASWIQEPQSARPGELCVETQLQQGAHVLVWTTAGACGMLQGCW